MKYGKNYDNVTDDIDCIDNVEENVMIDNDNVCSEECHEGISQAKEQDSAEYIH